MGKLGLVLLVEVLVVIMVLIIDITQVLKTTMLQMSIINYWGHLVQDICGLIQGFKVVDMGSPGTVNNNRNAL